MTNEQFATDMARVAARIMTDVNKPERVSEEPPAPFWHKENVVTGLTLNDYQEREPSEDGLYVKVTIHKERIEMIRQPLTPEEIAKRKEDQARAFKMGAVLIGAGVLTVVTLGVVDVLKARLRNAG